MLSYLAKGLKGMGAHLWSAGPEAVGLAGSAKSLASGASAAGKAAWGASNTRTKIGIGLFGAGMLLKSDALEYNFLQGYTSQYGEERGDSLRDKVSFAGTGAKVVGAAMVGSGLWKSFKNRSGTKAKTKKGKPRREGAEERAKRIFRIRESKKYGIPKQLMGFKRPILWGTGIGAVGAAGGIALNIEKKKGPYGRSSYRGTVTGLRPASLGGLAPGLQFSTGQGASSKPSKYSKRII